LKKGILVLSIVGTAGVVGQLFDVMRNFGGGIGSIFLNANDIYVARISNQLSGLPYAGAFYSLACVLAGVHVSEVRKNSHFVDVSSNCIGSASASFPNGAWRTWNSSCLILGVRTPHTGDPGARARDGQLIAGAVLVAAVLGGVFALVSAVRGLGVDYPGNTAAMDRNFRVHSRRSLDLFKFLSDSRSFQYVSFESRGSSTWLLGDVYVCPGVSAYFEIRVPTGVPPYEEDYWTPVPMNTGTYLKNVDSDFGPRGF